MPPDDARVSGVGAGAAKGLAASTAARDPRSAAAAAARSSSSTTIRRRSRAAGGPFNLGPRGQHVSLATAATDAATDAATPRTALTAPSPSPARSALALAAPALAAPALAAYGAGSVHAAPSARSSSRAAPSWQPPAPLANGPLAISPTRRRRHGSPPRPARTALAAAALGARPAKLYHVDTSSDDREEVVDHGTIASVAAFDIGGGGALDRTMPPPSTSAALSWSSLSPSPPERAAPLEDVGEVVDDSEPEELLRPALAAAKRGPGRPRASEPSPATTSPPRLAPAPTPPQVHAMAETLRYERQQRMRSRDQSSAPLPVAATAPLALPPAAARPPPPVTPEAVHRRLTAHRGRSPPRAAAAAARVPSMDAASSSLPTLAAGTPPTSTPRAIVLESCAVSGTLLAGTFELIFSMTHLAVVRAPGGGAVARAQDADIVFQTILSSIASIVFDDAKLQLGVVAQHGDTCVRCVFRVHDHFKTCKQTLAKTCASCASVSPRDWLRFELAERRCLHHSAAKLLSAAPPAAAHRRPIDVDSPEAPSRPAPSAHLVAFTATPASAASAAITVSRGVARLRASSLDAPAEEVVIDSGSQAPHAARFASFTAPSSAAASLAATHATVTAAAASAAKVAAPTPSRSKRTLAARDGAAVDRGPMRLSMRRARGAPKAVSCDEDSDRDDASEADDEDVEAVNAGTVRRHKSPRLLRQDAASMAPTPSALVRCNAALASGPSVRATRDRRSAHEAVAAAAPSEIHIIEDDEDGAMRSDPDHNHDHGHDHDHDDADVDEIEDDHEMVEEDESEDGDVAAMTTPARTKILAPAPSSPPATADPSVEIDVDDDHGVDGDGVDDDDDDLLVARIMHDTSRRPRGSPRKVKTRHSRSVAAPAAAVLETEDVVQAGTVGSRLAASAAPRRRTAQRPANAAVPSVAFVEPESSEHEVIHSDVDVGSKCSSMSLDSFSVAPPRLRTRSPTAAAAAAAVDAVAAVDTNDDVETDREARAISPVRAPRDVRRRPAAPVAGDVEEEIVAQGAVSDASFSAAARRSQRSSAVIPASGAAVDLNVDTDADDAVEAASDSEGSVGSNVTSSAAHGSSASQSASEPRSSSTSPSPSPSPASSRPPSSSHQPSGTEAVSPPPDAETDSEPDEIATALTPAAVVSPSAQLRDRRPGDAATGADPDADVQMDQSVSPGVSGQGFSQATNASSLSGSLASSQPSQPPSSPPRPPPPPPPTSRDTAVAVSITASTPAAAAATTTATATPAPPKRPIAVRIPLPGTSVAPAVGANRISVPIRSPMMVGGVNPISSSARSISGVRSVTPTGSLPTSPGSTPRPVVPASGFTATSDATTPASGHPNCMAADDSDGGDAAQRHGDGVDSSQTNDGDETADTAGDEDDGAGRRRRHRHGGTPSDPRLDITDLDRELFRYPEKAKGAITVHTSDYLRLDRGEFLNDTVIEFYLRYMLEQPSVQAIRSDIHMFNSFFYHQLTSTKAAKRSRSSARPVIAYDRVKTWTAKIDIFAKKYVFVPINQHLHWFLALIVNPGRLLVDAARRAESELGVGRVGLGRLGEDDDDDDDDEIICIRAHASRHQMTTRKELRHPMREGHFGIVLFDSLSNDHADIARPLYKWLVCEAHDKRGVVLPQDLPRRPVHARVPQQNNFSDCGIFLLQYVETFLADPEGSLARLSSGTSAHRDDWFDPTLIAPKRCAIQAIMRELNRQYEAKRITAAAAAVAAAAAAVVVAPTNGATAVGDARDDASHASSSGVDDA
ncbi:hypothetical protein CXG81DRAFT_16899 [Caulochytrium protostelioides]|uniref:Ubiquitin-like protease family profile domain-containing protein n=1 Tax=Caulochytrium protostelioides TaxID=1555241 RepID=A0A4V1IVD4_9FUNG|nr:hypothetical protein CXG81DRAFT_16899 [Caulochytrium protostelioides]|eukprot:RKP03669.1 hypothetical protein CXG81DRAFT_16899 [Caulochytrium protostelioides]